jgi:type I restriction enzyme S subunit
MAELNKVSDLTIVKSAVVPVPPTKEQLAICSHLDTTLHNVEKAIAAIKDEISLVREYIVRLVSDVVTGKLDVREAATRLPDEPKEAVPIDGTEADMESEEAEGAAETPEEIGA